MIVHHTGPAPKTASDEGDAKLGPAAGAGGTGGLSSVQQENYRTAFELALGADMGRMVEGGGEDAGPLRGRFAVRTWLGRRWLVAEQPLTLNIPRGAGEVDEVIDKLVRPTEGAMSWAVELGVAESVIRRLRGQKFDRGESRLEAPVSRQAARKARGAVFPDGLALISDSEGLAATAVRWDDNSRRFKVGAD